MSSDQKIAINRPLVGILALICLAASGIIYWRSPGEESWILWQAGFLRVGVVMSAAWFALPSLTQGDMLARVSPTTLFAALLGLLAIARLRIPVWMLLPLCAGAALAALILRPRKKERPRVRRGQG